MANSDHSLDIYVRVLAQEVGPEKAAQVIQRVKDETAKLTPEAQKATKGYSDLAQGLKQLGREFPILGAIARAVTNPLVAGFALLAVAIRALNAQIKETIALLEPAEWSGRSDAIKAGKEAFQEATVAANAYWQSLKVGESAMSEINTTTEIQITKIRELAEAQRKLLEERKKLDIETVKSKEDKGEITKTEAAKRLRDIEARFAGQEDRAARAEEEKVINALMQKRAEIITLIVNLETNLAGVQTEAAAAEAQLTQIEGERAVHEKNIASASEKIAAFDKEIESREKFGMRSAVFDSLTDVAVRSSRQSTIESRDAARRALGTLDAGRVGAMTTARVRRAGATAMESDLSGATSARREIERDIDAEATRTDLNRATRGSLGALGSASRAIAGGLGIGGRGIIGAAESADIIAAGGRVSKEQALMVNDVAKALGLVNQSTATVIRIVSQLNDNQVNFDRALKQIEGRVKTVNRNPVGS